MYFYNHTKAAQTFPFGSTQVSFPSNEKTTGLIPDKELIRVILRSKNPKQITIVSENGIDNDVISDLRGEGLAIDEYVKTEAQMTAFLEEQQTK